MSKSVARPRFELADVVRAHADDLCAAHPLSASQAKVLLHIAQCRTAALGGHVDECADCGYQRISYNSCRDRHCPKCQASSRAAWLEQRLRHLLPVPYFHVVFTLPHALNALVLQNRRLLFAMLFQAASATLQELAANPTHLGAQVGITAVLHTWGQNLQLHPHLHCVVTGGGLSSDGRRFIRTRRSYFLPVRVLGKLFRGKFLHALHAAWRDGRLNLADSLDALQDPLHWAAFKDRLYRISWVVYAKPPFGGPEHVFRYLGRYTHRVAISNHRILNFANGRVTFVVKDYANAGRHKVLTLHAVEFLRRFLLHVLPKAFVRIRHYGLHASANIKTKLARCQRLLTRRAVSSRPRLPKLSTLTSWWERFLARTGIDLMLCPCCGGRLVTLDPAMIELRVPSTARAP